MKVFSTVRTTKRDAAALAERVPAGGRRNAVLVPDESSGGTRHTSQSDIAGLASREDLGDVLRVQVAPAEAVAAEVDPDP